MNLSSKMNPVAFVVLNPVAGMTNPQILKRLIENRMHAAGWRAHFHFTIDGENTAEIVADALTKGSDLVIAAGGDGTVAAVAAGMVHSHTPLGIVPTGTWNAIARSLQIPFMPLRSLNLMTGNHKIKKLDLMEVGNQIHAMNIGIGFSSTMIKTTNRTEKRKFGNLAYFATIFKQIFGFQLRRYVIEADGVRYRGRATEIFVANYGMVGFTALESVLNVKPDDGKVDLLIFRARTILDLPSVFWQAFIKHRERGPKYRQISAAQSISIRTIPPIPVQADGELIGETPIEVRVLPRSVRVIVP